MVYRSAFAFDLWVRMLNGFETAQLGIFVCVFVGPRRHGVAGP